MSTSVWNKVIRLSQNNYPGAENCYWLKETEPLYRHREQREPFWIEQEQATWDT